VATAVRGRIGWSASRDDEGQREYKITHLVEAATTDGPQAVAQTAGLPIVGSTWAYSGDSDPWAFCLPTISITPRVKKEPNRFWEVENTFSTRPRKRCQDETIENPLNEPDRISGSFTKFTSEATRNRYGFVITNSSFEQLRGSTVEKSDNKPNVTIEKNLATLPLTTFAPMIDKVNDATLWGLPARCVKLSNVSWSREVYGVCSYYYTVSYEFDCDYTTFDKTVIDEGTMILSKGGDKDDPRDFEKYKDRNGENTRTILDGNGNAWDGTGTDGPGTQVIQLYEEANFLLLGIPTSL
jgi:hypothetical protein